MDASDLLREAWAVLEGMVTRGQMEGAKAHVERLRLPMYEEKEERRLREAEESWATVQERLRANEDYVRRAEAFQQFSGRFDALLLHLGKVDPAKWQAVVAASTAEGVYSVSLERLGERRGDPVSEAERLPFAASVATVGGVPLQVAEELMKRVQHVGPERLREGIALDDAVRVKTFLERWGGTVKLKEGVLRSPGSRRQPIPERVRREVWRRDGGRCVDCASRERLEFDHIIPVSQGGSNTARNLELRCERCNRSKAARI